MEIDRSMKVMIDFFSGLKGSSEYAKELGWKVITIDIEKKHDPNILIDLMNDDYNLYREIRYHQALNKVIDEQIYFCWFSPPCTEYSKDHMPWHESNIDLSLFLRCFEIVKELKPKYWIIENVIGAQKYFGRALFHLGPFYFWGWIPEIQSSTNHYFKSKLFPSEDRASLRAKIPYEVSKKIIGAIS